MPDIRDLSRRGKLKRRRRYGAWARGSDPGEGINNLLIAVGSNLLIRVSPESVLNITSP